MQNFDNITICWGVLGIFNFLLAIFNSMYTRQQLKPISSQPIYLPPDSPDLELAPHSNQPESNPSSPRSRNAVRFVYLVPAIAFGCTAILNLSSAFLRGNPFDPLLRFAPPRSLVLLDAAPASPTSLASLTIASPTENTPTSSSAPTDIMRAVFFTLAYAGHRGDEWETFQSLYRCAHIPENEKDGVVGIALGVSGTHFQCESDVYSVLMTAVFAISGVLNFFTARRLLRRGRAEGRGRLSSVVARRCLFDEKAIAPTVLEPRRAVVSSC